MQNRSARYSLISFVAFVCLAAVLASTACAAPQTIRMDWESASISYDPQVYILPRGAPAETVQATLDEIYANSTHENWQVTSIGKMPAITENYDNGQPLTTDGALDWPLNLSINGDALTKALLPHLVGRVGVSCVESGDQAFWVMDNASIASLLEDLIPGSELAESLASCGEVADCEDCGCIGPMSGPTCPTTLQSLEPTLYGQ